MEEKVKMVVDNLKIELNEANGGLCAVFEWDGQEYFADLCVAPAVNFTECEIFQSKDGQVTNWGELYCRRDIPVTEEQLKKCVEEFINEQKED